MPSGWSFEKHRMRMNARYRLDISIDSNATSATITHHLTGLLTSVSTNEPSVKNQLYTAADPVSSYNLGLLLAERCNMMGISHVQSFHKPDNVKAQRVLQLLFGLVDGGISFEEPEVIPHNHLNDANLTWDSFVNKPSRQSKLDELDLTLEPGKGVC